MSQSSTLCIGMDVHKETLAVAYVVHEHGAAVTSRGPSGTRQGDLAPLGRTRPSQATPLTASMPRALAAPGSPALAPTKAPPAGSWCRR
jgi:hypothetical protein